MFQKNALERGLLKRKKSLDLLAYIYISCPSACLGISPVGLQGQHRSSGKSRYQKEGANCAVYGLLEVRIAHTDF